MQHVHHGRVLNDVRTEDGNEYDCKPDVVLVCEVLLTRNDVLTT